MLSVLQQSVVYSLFFTDFAVPILIGVTTVSVPLIVSVSSRFYNNYGVSSIGRVFKSNCTSLLFFLVVVTNIIISLLYCFTPCCCLLGLLFISLILLIVLFFVEIYTIVFKFTPLGFVKNATENKDTDSDTVLIISQITKNAIRNREELMLKNCSEYFSEIIHSETHKKDDTFEYPYPFYNAIAEICELQIKENCCDVPYFIDAWLVGLLYSPYGNTSVVSDKTYFYIIRILESAIEHNNKAFFDSYVEEAEVFYDSPQSTAKSKTMFEEVHAIIGGVLFKYERYEWLSELQFINIHYGEKKIVVDFEILKSTIIWNYKLEFEKYIKFYLAYRLASDCKTENGIKTVEMQYPFLKQYLYGSLEYIFQNLLDKLPNIQKKKNIIEKILNNDNN